MHDLPLSPEDRGKLLQAVLSQPPRDRLLAEIVFGHGLDRRFANTTEQHRYTVVAARHLVPGEILPDELFGGTALGRFSPRRGAWYQAEAVQLHQRRTVRAGARWQVALARGNRIVGAVKTVTLRRG